MYDQCVRTSDNRFKFLFLMLVVAVTWAAGCGEKEKKPDELVIGNWTQLRNRAYVLLIINPKGTWNSSVRIADVTSKIVSAKGDANGTWHMEEGQLIFTVMASDIEEVWEKNDTRFFEVVDLQDRLMVLKEENGRVGEWKKTSSKKGDAAPSETDVVITMSPFAVNLNKQSSNAQDRYLCMSISLVLKELMPEQKTPTVHPKVRDAVIMFLSDLVYGDVENFDKIKDQKSRLINVVNPYMANMVKDVTIDHVIIAASAAKVEEFIIEHTVTESAGDGAAQDGEADKEGDKAKKETDKAAS